MTVPPLVERTKTAHWGWEEHRYFGHRVLADLAGDETLTGLTALGVTGRRLGPEEQGVIDDGACALTLADPRIWPLKLTRVVAAYGGTLSAAAAGLLSEEHARIGPNTGARSAELLLEFQRALGDEPEAERVRRTVHAYLAEHRFVWGFGTPFRQHDERLVAFRRCIERRGRAGLRFWRLMNAVSPVVLEARGTQPNMGLAIGAAFLDLGLTPRQIGALSSAIMHHMFMAHAVEASSNETTLRELPASYVTYAGREPRQSPRALGAREARPSGVRLATGT